MSDRRIFGWDYPPGAENDPNAPWNQTEGPCDVCGLDIDHCICDECPECGGVGDTTCYRLHGMVLTDEQRESKALAEQKCYGENDDKEADNA